MTESHSDKIKKNLGVDQMSKFYSLSPEMATHLNEQNVLEQDKQQQKTEKQCWDVSILS